MKIANYKIEISTECPEDKRKFINEYWELENSKFVNPPLKVARKYGLSLSILKQQVKHYSSAVFYLHCKKCNSHEKHTATSHSMLKHIIRAVKNPYEFSCDECDHLSREEIRKYKVIAEVEQETKSKIAIENKVWKDLTYFQRNVLNDVLEIDSFNKLRNYYIAKNIGMDSFWATLYTLNDYQLIILIKTECSRYIKDIKFLPEILEYLPEIKERTNSRISKVEFDSVQNELKFNLTKNENYTNSDYPVYSGVLTFPNEIVLKPNTEYTFGAWNRTKGNLYLSIIPIENIYNHPKQSRIKNQPGHIQETISSFFSQRHEDFDI